MHGEDWIHRSSHRGEETILWYSANYALREYCIPPDLEPLKQELMASCSGGEIKEINNELIGESSCIQCTEKAEFIQAIIDLKASN